MTALMAPPPRPPIPHPAPEHPGAPEDGPAAAGPAARATSVGAPTAKGLHRPRLHLALDGLWTRRVGLVIAPPGSGKTTLLASWSRHCGARLAWYPVEPSHTSAAAMLAQIYRSSVDALGVEGPWTTVDEAIDSLAARSGGLGLLVVDDLHVIANTPAESTLGEIIARLPANLRILVGTRRAPNLSLSRLRLEDAVLELTSDDLRFRTWETESLFRDHYGRAMLPAEIADLTNKTGGWAAGLQLFHLATRDKSPTECSRMLASFSAHSGLVAEYLADNVIAGLPGSMVNFMVLTCPLGVLTADACNTLSDRTDSLDVLRQMESLQLFVTSPDGGVTYRYHEILRSHLDGCLVARLGEAGAREWHYRAGRLLLAGGFHTAGLRALCRAEAWEKAGAVLAGLNKGATGGHESPGGCSVAIEQIPARLVDSDPWVGLARARCHVASGHLDAAVAAYRACEPGLPRRVADACRVEMVTVAAWASPIATPAPGWTNILRRAVAREPMHALAELASQRGYDGGMGRLGRSGVVGSAGASSGTADGGTEAGGNLDAGLDRAVTGLAALLAGQVEQAQGPLQEASTTVTSPILGLGVRIASTLAAMLGARSALVLQAGARSALAMASEAERLGSPWLSRQAYALLALAGRPEVAAQVSAQCERESDAWGTTIAQLLEGTGRLGLGQAPVEILGRAATNTRLLGAGVLEVWALAALSLAEARARNPQARELALGAEATARRAGVPGAKALAHLALGYAELSDRTSGDPAGAQRSTGRRSESRGIENIRLGRSMGDDCGLGILRRPPGIARTLYIDPNRTNPDYLEAAKAWTGLAPSRVALPGMPRSGGALAESVTDQLGAAQATTRSAGGLSVQCLGGLSAAWGDHPIDLNGLRPRARALLALLALSHPLPVHCEVLLEALWPGCEPRAGTRNLQTAVSSLRRVLVSELRPGGPHSRSEAGLATSPLLRRGEAYLLQAKSVDVTGLEISLRAASAARGAKDLQAEAAALAEVLATHGTDLLPEFGPADWAVKERERLRWNTIDSAERLAELRLSAGCPADALTAARTGLSLDHFRESLWRLAIRAAEATDDHGLASTLRARRTDALAELGITAST